MPDLLKPKRLPKHATIGVVAPASPMLLERLERGVQYLEKLGYRVEVGASAYKRRGYLAGSDAERIQDLNAMFRRPDIDAIFCVRGGYGTPRLLAQVDYQAIRENPKIFVGYSDITALHLAIFKMTGLVTFSGPMVAVEFGQGPEQPTEESFWRMITSPEPFGKLAPLAESGYTGKSVGESSGPLLGGCLSVMTALLGSPYWPDFSGAILVFEDVGEAPYRIDNYLAQLANAGILKRIAGMISGQFIDCKPEEGKPSLTIDEILDDYFAPLTIPRIQNFDYGHGSIKHTLPLGIRFRIRAAQATVEALEGAVV